MKKKSDDIVYINKFSKITIADACRHFNIDAANLRNGRCSPEIEKKVRKYLEQKIAEIYVEESEKYVK